MVQHAAPTPAPRRPVILVLDDSPVLRIAPTRRLLEGVAAQDALAALFDEFADEKPRERPSVD